MQYLVIDTCDEVDERSTASADLVHVMFVPMATDWANKLLDKRAMLHDPADGLLLSSMLAFHWLPPDQPQSLYLFSVGLNSTLHSFATPTFEQNAMCLPSHLVTHAEAPLKITCDGVEYEAIPAGQYTPPLFCCNEGGFWWECRDMVEHCDVSSRFVDWNALHTCAGLTEERRGSPDAADLAGLAAKNARFAKAYGSRV